MELKEALNIVIDLAWSGALTEELCDEEPNLLDEMIEQEAAIAVVEEFVKTL